MEAASDSGISGIRHQKATPIGEFTHLGILAG